MVVYIFIVFNFLNFSFFSLETMWRVRLFLADPVWSSVGCNRSSCPPFLLHQVRWRQQAEDWEVCGAFSIVRINYRVSCIKEKKGLWKIFYYVICYESIILHRKVKTLLMFVVINILIYCAFKFNIKKSDLLCPL